MDASTDIRRALLLTIPGAIVFSLPFGLRLHSHFGPRLGLAMFAPDWLILVGLSVLLVGTIVCSPRAMRACDQIQRQRPVAAGAVRVTNVFALLGAIGGYFYFLISISVIWG